MSESTNNTIIPILTTTTTTSTSTSTLTSTLTSTNTTNYWDQFYEKNHSFVSKPSTFAQFVKDYIDTSNDVLTDKKLIDMGCGNGRDMMYFKSCGAVVTGLDMSHEICSKLSQDGLDVRLGSMTTYDYSGYDVYYSRFGLHALDTYDEIKQFIKNLADRMSEDSILFIETRSIKGTEFENKDYHEHNFVSGIGGMHKRILMSMAHLIDLCNDNDLFAEYRIESNGLSVFKGEDPWLIRLVLRRVNVKNYLKKIMTSNFKARQERLRSLFNNIVTILEENSINYVVFFGNLIGLLRHNDLFIPWDDDIDILISKEDADRLKTIFYDQGYKTIWGGIEVFQVVSHDVWIDVFHDHPINKLVDVTDYRLLNGYRIPNDYAAAFNEFYNYISMDDVL